MSYKFIDFNEQIQTMRVNLDNEARALLRKSNIDKISFDVKEDVELLAISDEDGLWIVTQIKMIDDELIIVTESHNSEMDYMDCSTDDMVAIYENIYHYVVNQK